jgi:hypothetical protein
VSLPGTIRTRIVISLWGENRVDLPPTWNVISGQCSGTVRGLLLTDSLWKIRARLWSHVAVCHVDTHSKFLGTVMTSGMGYGFPHHLRGIPFPYPISLSPFYGLTAVDRYSFAQLDVYKIYKCLRYVCTCASMCIYIHMYVSRAVFHVSFLLEIAIVCVQWLTPIILATQEVESKRITVPGQSRQKAQDTPISTNS